MLMIPTALFFFAAIDAVQDVTSFELDYVSCDVLKKMSTRLYADKTYNILRAKVLRAENLEYRDDDGTANIYAEMEYETYGPENTKVQKSYTRPRGADSSPNWSEQRCPDVYFPTDFVIKDPENDVLRIFVANELDNFNRGSVEFSVKWLQSIIPLPINPVPTITETETTSSYEGREYLYSEYNKLHSVVFWAKVEGGVSGLVQVQVSLTPRLSFWKNFLPRVRIYKRSVDGLKMKPQEETRPKAAAKSEENTSSEKQEPPEETIMMF